MQYRSATKGLMDWQKFKFDNDMGSGCPANDRRRTGKTKKSIPESDQTYMGNPSPWTLMTRFDTRRDGDQLERLEGVIEKIEQLKRYWQLKADYIKKNPQGEVDSNTYSIVITRNPIDILRMSDFDNIQSCHSPPSRGDKSYYHCAVAEAHGEGAVAFVVKNEDLEEVFPFTDGVENITLDDYEGDELFYDDVRGVGDLTPISRLRLRLVRHYENVTPKKHGEGVDIAVPEEAVKGERIPGFEKALMDWARENQTDVVSKVMSQVEKLGGTLDLGKFTAFGGTYEDNTRQKLLIKFLDKGWTSLAGQVDTNTEAEDNVSVGPQGDARQLESDGLRYIADHKFSNFEVLNFSADYDEESAWISADVRLRLMWDADEWVGMPGMDILRYIPDELSGYGEEYDFLSDSAPSFHSGGGKILVFFQVKVPEFNEGMEYFYSAEDFEAMLDVLEEMEDWGGKVGVVKHVVEQFMKREGYMEGGAIMRLGYEVQSEGLKTYEWDWHVEEGSGDDPFDHIAAETRMWLSYGDIPEEVVKKVFSTREFWLEIRKRMHAPIHENFDYKKYYVDIEKFIEDFDEEANEVEFKLNYAAGAEDPDDTVEIFQQMIEHWDDEDMLYGLFNTVLKEYAAQVADLTPMEDPESDMNENKKVSGQQLFNNWREFLQGG
jgi:hypothetical protein